ncbi:MAG: DMT family transporter [Anaerolineae bacterium]|nr:DMT family transporter [Anaerolineae bacterium]
MFISERLRGILQALFVTFLWSTSWVLIKFALNEIPPLTFAGLRYTLAFIILLPGLWKYKTQIKTLSAKTWRNLVVLGLVFYTITQGGQFLTLNYLEAVTFSLLLNFSSVLVALFGIIALREVPSRLQWGGIIIFITGVFVYFTPAAGSGEPVLGFGLAGLSVCANAAASILGRSINRDKTIPPLVVTAISMGIGATSLLGIGLVVQGLPPISLTGWGVIGWLAVVNTALAFTLWNKSLQKLSAVESSLINNTMLVQIAVLAWLFLGEQLSARDIMGLILAITGILLAHLKKAV